MFIFSFKCENKVYFCSRLFFFLTTLILIMTIDVYNNYWIRVRLSKPIYHFSSPQPMWWFYSIVWCWCRTYFSDRLGLCILEHTHRFLHLESRMLHSYSYRGGSSLDPSGPLHTRCHSGYLFTRTDVFPSLQYILTLIWLSKTAILNVNEKNQNIYWCWRRSESIAIF